MAERMNLDAAREALAEASNGIDGPDLPYNWAALRAMRTAEQLLDEAQRQCDRADIAEAAAAAMKAERDAAVAHADQPATPVEARLANWVELARAGDVGAIRRVCNEVLRLDEENRQAEAAVDRLTKDNLYLNRMLNHDNAALLRQEYVTLMQRANEAETDAVSWRRETARLVGALGRVRRVLAARHEEGCTYIRMADVRAALDFKEPS